MKKIYIVMMVFLVTLTLVTTGCGSKTETTDQAINQAPPGQEQQGQPPSGGNAGERGTGNFQRADLIGEVSAITGNTISLKLIEQPEPGLNRGQNRNSEQNEGQPPSPPNQPPDQSQQQPGEMAVKYTGETKEITVPADISITRMAQGQNGPEITEIKTEDIKVGDMLQIWYSDQEKEVISKIGINSFGRNT